MLTRENAPVTKVLVGINFAVHFFLYGIVLSADDPANRITEIYLKFGLVPADFWDGSVWQPFTSMFLHGFVEQAAHAMAGGDVVNAVVLMATMGLLHIAVNMVGVWSLGGIIERTIGPARYAWLYIVSGLCGALFVLIFNRGATDPTVGASGALLGLLGALAVFFPNAQVLLFFVIPIRARTIAIGIGLISLVLIFMDNLIPISHSGHLGGLVGGILYSRFALGFQFQIRSDGTSPGSSGKNPLQSRGRASRQEEEMLDALNDFFTSSGSEASTSSQPTPNSSYDPSTEASSHPQPQTPDAEKSHQPKHEVGQRGVPPSAGYPTSEGYPSSQGFPASDSNLEPAVGLPSGDEYAPSPNVGSSAINEDGSENVTEDDDMNRKRLHFDPETGRFGFGK